MRDGVGEIGCWGHWGEEGRHGGHPEQARWCPGGWKPFVGLGDWKRGTSCPLSLVLFTQESFHSSLVQPCRVGQVSVFRSILQMKKMRPRDMCSRPPSQSGVTKV